MAQTIVINGNTYADVPEIQSPKASGQGKAKFVDTSDGTADASKLRNGETAYVNGEKITGNMTEKSAQTYTPTTSDQTISANQYLTGAQTVKGDANLVSGNILQGVSIFSVQGSASLPTITQDSTTKILTIE